MSRIKRAKRDTNFVLINKEPLQDERLSWKAKGLLSYLLSLPDNWQIYISELQKHSKDGRDSTRSALKELIENGYIKRDFAQRVEGKFTGYDYTVYELPLTDSPKTEKPKTVNPPLISNNSNKNNIKVNIISFEKEVRDILTHFSEVTGKEVRVPKTKTKLKNYKHYKSIAARLNKGASVEDIKEVISFMCAKWESDSYMRKYRRISTLVGDKYDEYIEEVINKELEPKNTEQTTTNPQDLVTYYRDRRKFDDFKIKYMGDKGVMQQHQAKLKEVSFKCHNIAKSFRNESIDTLLIFDICYGFLGKFLKTNNADHRLDKFKAILSSKNDYVQNKGDILQLMLQLEEKTL